MEKKGGEKGELVLLGVFALFVMVFLWDIRSLPMEGKMLSYLAAPLILLTILLCVRGVFKAEKKAKTAEPEVGEAVDAVEAAEHKPEHSSATWRFNMTIAAGLFMFAGIYLIGFYLGSGLMMISWFAVFRKLNRGTITLSIATPLLLFLTFEKLLDMGLPSGELLSWLGL